MKIRAILFTYLTVICFCIIYPTLTMGVKIANVATSAEQIFLYTYHTHPPFIISAKRGLSYDLAHYLTEKSHGRYTFTVKAMSKPRVEKYLTQGQNGVIPWVNPVWFKDVKEEKYMWTKGGLMEDGNAIISHQDKKIIYDGPESLKGMTFGGLRGHVYLGIDDYIKETGQLVRVNAENHIDNFRKLAKKHIDVTLMPASGASYYINKEKLVDVLYISPKLHTSFQRRAIVINHRRDILDFLETIFKGMQDDPVWTKTITTYESITD